MNQFDPQLKLLWEAIRDYTVACHEGRSEDASDRRILAAQRVNLEVSKLVAGNLKQERVDAAQALWDCVFCTSRELDVVQACKMVILRRGTPHENRVVRVEAIRKAKKTGDDWTRVCLDDVKVEPGGRIEEKESVAKWAREVIQKAGPWTLAKLHACIVERSGSSNTGTGDVAIASVCKGEDCD